MVPDQPSAPKEDPAQRMMIINIKPTPKTLLKIIATEINMTTTIRGVRVAESSCPDSLYWLFKGTKPANLTLILGLLASNFSFSFSASPITNGTSTMAFFPGSLNNTFT